MFWSSSQLRETFLTFFSKNHRHSLVPSSSVVLESDQTLLFVNAGMVQFKEIFIGISSGASNFAKLERATNTQRCIRAGGKHNDLDDVGRDSYHHTYFEMLGTWSFGDYFKQEAIPMVWEFLTTVLGLPASSLYVTYFEGCPILNLGPDDETPRIWRELGIQENHILPFGSKDNFWEMGETGPCGPCTEIHFDLVGNRQAADLVNKDSPDVIEIWNLVFMEFFRKEDGTLQPLPKKHVDTGAGFERLVSILQGKKTNYATDIFSPYMKAISAQTGAPPYQDRYGKDDKNDVDMAYRIVADHLRTLAAGIGDGVAPSITGRGYVIRRIARRGLRYFVDKLGGTPGKFALLTVVAVEELGKVFPELLERKKDIREIVEAEEKLFSKTLSKGRKQLERIVRETRKLGEMISGENVWRLYDTYGFPVDLTRLMALEQGLAIDEEGFLVAEHKAREISKHKKNIDGGLVKPTASDILKLQERGIPETEDSAKYDDKAFQTKIACFITKNGVKGQVKGNAVQVAVLLKRTCFYAERGGQESDQGTIEGTTGKIFVTDVQFLGDYIIHHGTLTGMVESGEIVMCLVDVERKSGLRRGHTAAHIFGFYLRSVYGVGSFADSALVQPDKIRIEINRKAFGKEEISDLENFFGEIVKESHQVLTTHHKLAEAKEIPNIIALFDGKYPEIVRVVSIPGLDSPKNDVSCTEICGGLHCYNTSELGSMVFCADKSISKGKRRLILLVGKKAQEARKREKEVLEKCSPEKRTAEVLAEFEKEQAFEDIPMGLRERLREILIEEKKKQTQRVKEEGKKRMQEIIADAEKLCREEQVLFDVGTKTKKEILTMLSVFEEAAHIGLLISEVEGEVQYAALPLAKKTELLQSVSVFHQNFGGRNWTNKNILMGSVPLHETSRKDVLCFFEEEFSKLSLN